MARASSGRPPPGSGSSRSAVTSAWASYWLASADSLLEVVEWYRVHAASSGEVWARAHLEDVCEAVLKLRYRAQRESRIDDDQDDGGGTRNRHE